MNAYAYIWSIVFVVSALWAPCQVRWNGQYSGLVGYGFQEHVPTILGSRYIGGAEYTYNLDSFQSLSFEASANVSGSLSMYSLDSITGKASIQPYRVWARMNGKQWEFRLGLQKIDFGKAKILRPLQWFNQMDPRDPLQLTNGVYGGLGRYYFLNNANIWLWALYGNDHPRGFDFLGSNKNTLEYGGRIQSPIKKGEIGISYHHRNASTNLRPNLPVMNAIPEDRFGLDMQLDLTIGIWLEVSKVVKHVQTWTPYPKQNLLATMGMDYTFGVGNGLSFLTESMWISNNNSLFTSNNSTFMSSFMATYPITMLDNLSLIAYQVWSTEAPAALVNYQHDFKKITTYFQAYYFPSIGAQLQQNELVKPFSGPGFRFQIVYNH